MMFTAINDQLRINASSLRSVIARHPVVTFLVLAYFLFGSILITTASFGAPFRRGSSLGAIGGLAIPAFLVTVATSGKAGVCDLLRRCLKWRVNLLWYALALFGLLVSTLLFASVVSGETPLVALVEQWTLVFTLFLPEIVFAVVFIQLFEEAAWTGFLQHRLQFRHGPLLASLLVAPALALGHLVLKIVEAPRLTDAFVLLAIQVILSIFLRVVIMWFYNGSGRSVLIVGIFHTAFNSGTGSGDMRFLRELMPGPEAFWIPSWCSSWPQCSSRFSPEIVSPTRQRVCDCDARNEQVAPLRCPPCLQFQLRCASTRPKRQQIDNISMGIRTISCQALIGPMFAPCSTALRADVPLQ